MLGSTYIEPFLGGASMFFAVEPARAILSDLNDRLIKTYMGVACDSGTIKSSLKQLVSSSAQYASIRSLRPQNTEGTAIQTIYLNRNCWGGLYRENLKGDFNVPYGGGTRTHHSLCKSDVLDQCATALAQPGIELIICDFETAIARADERDVVYCDPTYRPVTRDHFDRYGSAVFGWNDQERLAAASLAAAERGALVIVSNVSCAAVRELYQPAATVRVERPKGLGPKGTLRDEYLFVLDPDKAWDDWKALGALTGPPTDRSLDIAKGQPTSASCDTAT